VLPGESYRPGSGPASRAGPCCPQAETLDQVASQFPVHAIRCITSMVQGDPHDWTADGSAAEATTTRAKSGHRWGGCRTAGGSRATVDRDLEYTKV
jgi:hypothetical protein